MGNEAGRFTAVKDLNVIVHNLKEDQVKIDHGKFRKKFRTNKI